MQKYSGFRLLSELYSLLWGNNVSAAKTEREISFRLLSELYSLLFCISISIVCYISISFRLLSELYSLLSEHEDDYNNTLDRFRLLSELYSLLYRDALQESTKISREFPSPIGVIFSLIIWTITIIVNVGN